jgi:hypothetical protein
LPPASLPQPDEPEGGKKHHHQKNGHARIGHWPPFAASLVWHTRPVLTAAGPARNRCA